MRHPEWLTQVQFTWDHINHPGLSFDVIALRDIEEDEEILIDYGIEWETAWREHVTNFDPPRRGYTPAFEMNQQVDLQAAALLAAAEAAQKISQDAAPQSGSSVPTVPEFSRLSSRQLVDFKTFSDLSDNSKI